MSNKKIHMALVYRACPCCGMKDEKQGEILMDTVFKLKSEIEEAHNKVIGFGSFCETCLEETKDRVALVGVDMEKTEDENNPYRTGERILMKDEVVPNFVKNDEELAKSILEKRVCFVPQELLDHLKGVMEKAEENDN